MGWPVNSQSGNHFDYLLCLLISWLNAIELQWNPALPPRRYYGPFYWPPGKNCHTFSCKKTLVNMATLLIPPIFLGPLVTILTGFHWTWVMCLIHAIPHWSLVSFMLVFGFVHAIHRTNILFDRHLVCLRADVSYFLCCTRKRDVCVTPSLIVFQRPAGRVFYFA